MIRPIDIRLNAAHPDLKLPESVTFTGSPSTVFIRGVPPNYGRWAITAVSVAATFPDGSTTTRAAVQSANGVWVATLPGTATSGRTTDGFRVIADGIDENGEAATGYILAVADFAVASLDVTPAPQPGETSWQMLYFDAVPSVLRKGDVTKIDGVLKFYNGEAWEPFAGDIPAPSTATPAMDGTGSAGSSTAYARGDHVHPSDNTKLDKSGGTMTGGLTMDGGNLITFSDQSGTRRMTIGLYNDIFEIKLYSHGNLVYTWRTPFTSGVFALASELSYKLDSSSAAPAFTAKTYAANDLCTYNSVIYRCKVGYTATASSATPVADTTHWEPKKVSELFLPLTGGEMTGALKIRDSIGFEWRFGVSASSAPCIEVYQGGILFGRYYPSEGTGNLALYGSIGLVAYVNGKSYMSDSLVVKDGGVYRCTASPASTESWVASEWEKLFDLDTGAPASGGTKLITNGQAFTAIAGKADVSAIPYDLVTKTIDNGAVTLDDRAINAVAVSSSLASLTVNFPTATSGKARDFGLRLTVASGITTAPELALPQGVTCENADGEAPEIGADGAATILYFTETASGVFLVKGEVLQTITQA